MTFSASDGRVRPRSQPDEPPVPLTKQEYERLAAIRYALRRLVRETEVQARHVGTTPQQYLLLLAIKGQPHDGPPNMTQLAETLQIRHNAVIQLVNRAVAGGLVVRREDPNRPDRRTVQIHLTAKGERMLARVSGALRVERQRIADLAGWLNAPPDSSISGARFLGPQMGV